MQNVKAINAENITNQIVKWLKDYAVNAGSSGFVIGISGGIDSAVTSTLCAKTGLKVLCVEMPIHQAISQVSRGQEHISQLKARYSNVSSTISDLTPVFEQFRNQVSNDVDDAKLNMALANSRARLRMTTLYYFAGIYGLLVAGTGNKVEDFGIGFFTKYGDGGVDLSPIADLMKSEVFIVGKYLNIPDSILKAKPTDGLFGDDHSDEDQIGANYDELEWAMREISAETKSERVTDRQKVVMEIYKRLNKSNQHKMNSIPVCLLKRD